MNNNMRTLLLTFFLCFPILATAQDTSWKASSSADTLKNSFTVDQSFIALGQKTFESNCKTCHGKKGKGNGPAAIALNPRPANLQSKFVQNESEGALYWKISTGRKGMPSWKKSLSKKQKWAVITYIRSLTQSNEDLLTKNKNND